MSTVAARAFGVPEVDIESLKLLIAQEPGPDGKEVGPDRGFVRARPTSLDNTRGGNQT